MPRVAADQARTGPLLTLSQLQPGDLLFYHTDPTAPSYISHVAIYVGNGMMLQAPEPGMDVEIVKADFGAGFAGAIRDLPEGRRRRRGQRRRLTQASRPANARPAVPAQRAAMRASARACGRRPPPRRHLALAPALAPI